MTVILLTWKLNYYIISSFKNQMYTRQKSISLTTDSRVRSNSSSKFAVI